MSSCPNLSVKNCAIISEGDLITMHQMQQYLQACSQDLADTISPDCPYPLPCGCPTWLWLRTSFLPLSQTLWPCPWPRTQCQPPGTPSPCSDAAALPVSGSPLLCLATDLAGMGPHLHPALACPGGGAQCRGLGLTWCLLAVCFWLEWWMGCGWPTDSAIPHGDPQYWFLVSHP